MIVGLGAAWRARSGRACSGCLAIALGLWLASASWAGDPAGPWLDTARTPMAGEGFRTVVFGETIDVPSQDLGRIFAWDLGAAAVPEASGGEILPFASLYLWRRTDAQTWLRGVFSGVYNSLWAAWSPDGDGGLELIGNFENYTVPVDQSDWLDGRRNRAESLLWGRIHGGLGLGYRGPSHPAAEGGPGGGQGAATFPDNLWEISLLGEAGFLYFDRGEDAPRNFEPPEETLELRAHGRFRVDRLRRNLLGLMHHGFAGGADLFFGFRERAEDWGQDRREGARPRYFLAMAYWAAAGGVPWEDGERQRWLLTLHGGGGADLDRFSQPRIGGGPGGDEYEALSRPILPGALIEEYPTDAYAVAVAEYRYELAFFAYLSARGAVAYVQRPRADSAAPGGQRESDDLFAALGGRWTSGFILETRLQVDYAYNFDVIRSGERGGHEVVFHISGSF